MLFNRIFRQKKETPAWRGVIMEWIEKLKAGDLSALRVVYSAFATEDTGLIRRAGEAVRLQTASMTQTQLLGLCERFRTFSSLEWNIDWAEVYLEPVRKILPTDT